MSKMRSLLLVSVLASAMAAPVLADDGYGPREPVAGASNAVGVEETVLTVADACNPWADGILSYACSSTAATAMDKGGQHPLSAAELTAQQKVNAQHRKALWERVAREGGCNADTQPFEIASVCGGAHRAFGDGPQMGSNGGD